MKRLLVPVILLAIVVAACGGNGSEGTEAQECGPEIVAQDNLWEPGCLETASGTMVTVPNEGEALHSFTVADLDISEDIQAGATIDVPIEGAPGDYELTCVYHSDMNGTLRITGQ